MIRAPSKKFMKQWGQEIRQAKQELIEIFSTTNANTEARWDAVDRWNEAHPIEVREAVFPIELRFVREYHVEVDSLDHRNTSR